RQRRGLDRGRPGRINVRKRAKRPRSDLRSDAIHADWPHDILEALLAEILEDAIEPVPHLVVHDRRHTDAAGLGHALQPRRDVDAVRSEEHTSELQSLAYLVC